MQLSEVKKTVVTALGIIVALGAFVSQNLGFLSSIPWGAKLLTVVGLVAGAATVILNYLAPNETTNAERAVGRSVRIKGQQPI